MTCNRDYLPCHMFIGTTSWKKGCSAILFPPFTGYTAYSCFFLVRGCSATLFPLFTGYTAYLLVRGSSLGHDMTVEQDRRNPRNLLSCWYKNPPENPRMASHSRRHVLLFDTRSCSCIKPCACCTWSSRQGRFLCGVGLLQFLLLL